MTPAVEVASQLFSEKNHQHLGVSEMCLLVLLLASPDVAFCRGTGCCSWWIRLDLIHKPSWSGPPAWMGPEEAATPLAWELRAPILPPILGAPVTAHRSSLPAFLPALELTCWLMPALSGLVNSGPSRLRLGELESTRYTAF